MMLSMMRMPRPPFEPARGVAEPKISRVNQTMAGRLWTTASKMPISRGETSAGMNSGMVAMSKTPAPWD